ncbi:MAG: hypothetical protein R2867_40535 [Caldilineaceae bacterium]
MTKSGLVNSYLGRLRWGCRPFWRLSHAPIIQTLPTELTEAATIDGCSRSGSSLTLFSLAKPLAVLWGSCLYGPSNAFSHYQLLSIRKEMMPLTVGFALLSNRELRVNYGALMAAATYMALAQVIVFFMFQRYFVQDYSGWN